MKNQTGNNGGCHAGKTKKYQSMQGGSKSGSKAVVQVGDIVTRKPVTFFGKERAAKVVMHGKVVWVHPQGRFHTVEFGEGEYALRESFMGVER